MIQCYYRDELIKGCSRYSPSLVAQEHDIWDKYDHRNHKQRKGEPMGSGESDARIKPTIRASDTITLTYEQILQRIRAILLEREQFDVLVLMDLLPDHLPTVDKK